MAEIGYKTRGKASPTGKPRVWFCAHPVDSETYFEHITNQKNRIVRFVMIC